MSRLDGDRRAAPWVPAVFAVAAFLMGGGATPSGQVKPLPEAAVKAEFLLRFPEFVSWPKDNTQGIDPAPIVVCLSPLNKLGPTLSPGSTHTGQRPRRVTVRQLLTLDELNGCDALYLERADAAVLDALAARPVLTVGDHPGFCQRGGIINLLVIDGRVRFEVNLERARRVGLRIDSQLLRLATKVHGGEP